MNKSLFSIATASVFALGVGVASAETTTTTTWTPDQGTTITKYSTTQKYTSYSDPAMKPSVGMVLPPAVTVYPLPGTVVVPSAERYSYGIINERPVVIQRDNRTVVHTW